MSRNAGAPGAESPVRLAGPSAWRPIPVPHRLGQANRIEQFMTMRYVVGFDGSGPSEAALAWTIHRARHEPAPIVLVHVAEGDDGAMGEEYEDLATRRGAAMLSKRIDGLRRAHPELTVEGLALEGSVAWELARAVEPADLLIVGTHKTGFLHGRVLGSRSVQIAAAAPSSVAVIPEVDLRFRRGVVAGIDRAETAGAIAGLAADEAASRSDELSLMEAVTTVTPVQDRAPLAVAIVAAHQRHPALVIRSRTSTRPAAEALLDASRDKALLVLGPGSLDPRRSPIGSVLHDVLLNLNAPVIVARPLGFGGDPAMGSPRRDTAASSAPRS
jgi:nucleotide-binding universal stress UspA family protein